MRLEENVCHILVLSYRTLQTADAVGAWNEARTELTPFAHVVVFHYHFNDDDAHFFILLDLLDFVRYKFFPLILLAPSAASWCRARHANSVARHPLGCPNHSAKERQTTQDSNNSFLVAAWFVEQTALQCVPFLFLCCEDFGGHSQHGWARAALVARGVSAPQRVQ